MGTHTFRVEPGHVLVFARAVGDEDLARDLPAPGTTVPATFLSAAAQFDPVHMRGLQPAGALADTTSRLGGSVLHAEQEFEYFAPVCVGDQLTVTEYENATWRKHSRRAGDLLFREILSDYHDVEGNLVLRSRMVLVDTEFTVREAEL